MNRVYGTLEDFALIMEDASRFVVAYGLTPVDYDPDAPEPEPEPEEEGHEEQDEGHEKPVRHATWNEVYFYKAHFPRLTLDMVKEAVLADIDAQTDEKILNGYPFTPDGQEEPVIVWLSKESQTNFSEAHRLQFVPIKFKLNETADKQPVYHVFETFEELDRFYRGGVQWINQCLNEGWAAKDSIDWEPYDLIINPPEPEPEPVEETDVTADETGQTENTNT